MGSEITRTVELAALERLENQFNGYELAILRSINQTLSHHDFRIRDLRTSPYFADERLKLFSDHERALIQNLCKYDSKLVDLLPVRDVLFNLAELKQPEKKAASGAFAILMGAPALAAAIGLILWVAAANGGVDWQVTAITLTIWAILFAWVFGLYKRDELRARRVWRSARERAGFYI